MVSDYKANSLFSKYLLLILLTGSILFSVTRCKISYSFSGASISAKVKTISIQYFLNMASVVQPTLSQALTDALINKCKSQTSLSFVNGIGDVNFEGQITEYNTRPLTVSADATAAMNRFTIAVKVKFTNSVEPDLSYEKTFSQYQDYDSNSELSQVEKDLSDKIITLLVEEIFNQAFVNW
jgi:hypothetical protein